MQSLHRVSAGDLQRFLDAPEELLGESEEIQIAIATFSETPRSVLQVLLNSEYSEVVEASRLHVNWVGEERGDYREVVSEVLRNKDLGENDRFAVELMRFAPVPPEFLSEWVPVKWLIQGLKNQYMPLQYRLQLLERLSREGELEARLQVAESCDTPVSLLELLAGDLDLAVRLAVEYNDNCPSDVVELVKNQHDLAGDWDADIRDLEELGESRWSWVRLAVAQNPFAPVQILKRLSEDKLPKIQLEVAKNPKTQKWILEELSKHPHIDKYPEIGVYIQAAIAEHPNITGEVENKDIPFLGRHKLRLNKEKASETSQARYFMTKRVNTPFALAQISKNSSRDSKITAARNPKTPVSILEQLAKDKDEDVCSVLVENPNLPSNCLIELAENSQFNVQLAIARRIHPTPIEVLLQFSLHEDKIIRSEIAQNKNTPSDILTFLAEDKERDVRINSLANANIPSEVVFQALLNTKDKEELKIILQAQKDMMLNSLMSPEILERLSHHPEYLIRFTVATYPTASAKTLERLALHEYEIIPEAVAENPSTPASILIELAKRDYYATEIERYHSISYTIAIRKDAPPEALEYIVCQPIVPLVIRALENTNTPISALQWLVENQENESILGLVAKHPNTTPDILISLSANKSVKVRQVVASQLQCPLEILEILANDSAVEVQEKVAANPNTPNQILENFARSEDTAIRTAVASNPSLSQTTLEQLAHDEKIEVRRQVAQNPNTPISIRENLRDTVLLPKKQQQSPTLNSLPRIYNPSSDDLATVLTEYAESDNAFLRFVVLLHPLTPNEILTQGANSASWLERYAVAENEATSLEIRETLVSDGNWIVRAAANQSLSNSN
ncbi:MAG: hypothetical protein AAFV71_21415 [Cyanobacteria bacterium J06633_8]